MKYYAQKLKKISKKRLRSILNVLELLKLKFKKVDILIVRIICRIAENYINQSFLS